MMVDFTIIINSASEQGSNDVRQPSHLGHAMNTSVRAFYQRSFFVTAGINMLNIRPDFCVNPLRDTQAGNLTLFALLLSSKRV